MSLHDQTLRSYVFDDDAIYNGLVDLLGVVEREIPVDIEAEDEESVIPYQEESFVKNASTDISETGQDESPTETKTLDQALFTFTYTPRKNCPEKISYKDSFVTKLSPKVDLETLVLGEEPYPQIFAIEIQAISEEEKMRNSIISQTSEGKPSEEVWPKHPKFVFTYKTEGQDQCQESLKYIDKLTIKLPATLEWEEILFMDQKSIEGIIDSYVNKE